MVFEKDFPVVCNHCRTGRFRNENGVNIFCQTFKEFDILFRHSLDRFDCTGKVGRCTAALLCFWNDHLDIELFEYLYKRISNAGIVIVCQTADKNGNFLLLFAWHFGRDCIRVAVEKAGFCHRGKQAPLFDHRHGKTCTQSASLVIFGQCTGFKHIPELHHNVHHFPVFKQEKGDTLEPGNTVFLGKVSTYLFNNHIGWQRVGADIDTVGTQKTAFKNIFGSFVQRQVSLLIGTKQINEPAW